MELIEIKEQFDGSTSHIPMLWREPFEDAGASAEMYFSWPCQRESSLNPLEEGNEEVDEQTLLEKSTLAFQSTPNLGIPYFTVFNNILTFKFYFM